MRVGNNIVIIKCIRHHWQKLSTSLIKHFCTTQFASKRRHTFSQYHLSVFSLAFNAIISYVDASFYIIVIHSIHIRQTFNLTENVFVVSIAHFCHLNHFCHSSPVLSIHINRFYQPHHFCQPLSTQSSPVLSTISTTYVAADEVTTFVNKARPLLSTVMLCSYLCVLCSVTLC